MLYGCETKDFWDEEELTYAPMKRLPRDLPIRLLLLLYDPFFHLVFLLREVFFEMFHLLCDAVHFHLSLILVLVLGGGFVVVVVKSGFLLGILARCERA